MPRPPLRSLLAAGLFLTLAPATALAQRGNQTIDEESPRATMWSIGTSEEGRETILTHDLDVPRIGYVHSWRNTQFGPSGRGRPRERSSSASIPSSAGMISGRDGARHPP